MYSAFICQWSGFDLDDIMIGCKGEGEFICLKQGCCCAANADKYDTGLTAPSPLDMMLCKIGLPCCFYGIKMPNKFLDPCCAGESQCFCLKAAQALPFGGPVPSPVCAVCFLACLPQFGCCVEPPAGGGGIAGVVTQVMK